MSTEFKRSSWFGHRLGKSTFQALGAGVLLSGAVLFGACGDDDDDPTDGAETIVTGAGTTAASAVATDADTDESPTTSATMSTGSPTTGSPTTGSPTTGTPSTGSGSPTTGTPSAGDDDIMTVFEDEFSDRPWFTAVEDVELNDGDVVVTVGADAATLTDAEIEEMCNEVSEVAFSAVIGDDVEMLTIEDDSGAEIASATAEGECTVA